MVLRLLGGESLEALSREVGVEISRLEEWRERAMAGLELGLQDRHGEGHRKVHARLRILDGIRVARTRVLRVMRAHGLLSPHRASGHREDSRREGHHPGAQRDVGDGRRARIHARRRVGLDLRGGRTLERGVCGGGTCAKSGAASRHSIRWRKGSNVSRARWPPTSPAGWRFGWITAVSTCQTIFLTQIRYWGIHPSCGFVEEPETNGVAERWNRTLKEQAIHGRIVQNLEAVRAAVADFVERYNQTWRLEKRGYQTPIEAREEYELRPGGIA